MDRPKEYLGDSVYAEFDGYGVKLTTENGGTDGPSNEIYIEPSTFAALERFLARLKTKPDVASPGGVGYTT